MPLTFDMPREQLAAYTGTNPCPSDFTELWERGVAEIADVDPSIELVPARFQTSFAECSHLYFRGTGGARVHTQLLRPSNATKPHPAVLMFHGYAGNSGDWFSKLPYVSQASKRNLASSLAMDCRGQGGRSEDQGGVTGTTLRGHIIRGLDGPPEQLLFRQIFLDTAQLARIVMDMPDINPDRVGATGRSQGGGLTLACAALEPRLQRAAPVFRSCVTTSVSGSSISLAMPTANCRTISEISTPFTSAILKSSYSWDISTSNTYAPEFRPRFF